MFLIYIFFVLNIIKCLLYHSFSWHLIAFDVIVFITLDTIFCIINLSVFYKTVWLLLVVWLLDITIVVLCIASDTHKQYVKHSHFLFSNKSL